jgi:uncharacterized membrane protein YdjX (TVP38/TMEM64 family)
MKNKKKLIFRIILIIAVVAITVVLLSKFFPSLRKINTTEGQEEFKEMVASLGFQGMLLLFGLELLQVALIILPGEPIEILAGMCYGPVWGTVFITVSVFIITTVIYFLVNKYGKGFVYKAFSKERIERVEKSKLFKSPKRLETILVILFAIPGTPKDLLVYLGGLLPIKALRFILISTFIRFPSVISSTLVGANVTRGNWKASVGIYAITIILTGIFLIIVNRKDKNTMEVTRDIMM